MRIYLAVPLVLLIAVLAGYELQTAARGASDVRMEETIPYGTSCLVQLQRNALGAGSSTPISATLKQFDGSVLSYEGKMKLMNPDWIVVTLSDGSDCWIAKSAVLTITNKI